MFVGINLGINQLRSSTSITSFSPASLFASNEPGVWYDPSDLTTLFTDTAGTTPVTTPGQTVALMLDKSKGLTLGSELVTNGDFSGGTTGWSVSGGTQAVVSGALVATPTPSGVVYSSQSFTTVIGRSYQVRGSILAGTSTFFAIRKGDGATGGANQVTLRSSVGESVGVFTATATTSFVILQANDSGSATFDNISVRELAGNHATQATAASRPTYGVVPLGGRRNLLLQTESFTTVDWTKTSLTVSGNRVTYAGGLGGTKECVQLVTIPGGTASKVLTAYVTVSGTGTFRLKNTHSGVLDNFSANTTATSTPQTVTLTVTNSASAGNGLQAISIINSTGDAAFDLTVHAFQLELGSTATAYQRVSTAFDVTEAGIQSLSYLNFEVSDSMVTSTITPGTDKVQVFAGVQKLSDAASYAMVAEFSANSASNAGAFALMAPYVGATYGFDSKGTLPATAASPTSFASPIRNVLSGLGDIAGDNVTLRVNGTQVAQSTANQGTGNFLAYPLYVGMRGGVGLPFNGNIFSLITRFGANLTTDQIADTETWVAGKTGINIANNISTTIFARDDTAVLDRANSIIERRA